MNRNFDFTDLVLLVGTNPLPNYVVAKYFCSQNQNLQRIWLLYSEKTFFYEGTRQFADDIEVILLEENKEKTNIEIKKRALSNISRADTITEEINDQLLQESDRVEKIHLNYTGGTKAMAVHAYRELEKQWQNHFSASYLDARDYRIVFDHKPEEDTGDLREIIGITWDDLFRLHNHKKSGQQKSYLDCLEQTERDNILRSIANVAKKGKLLELKGFYKATQINYKGENIGLLNKPRDIPNLRDLIDQELGNFNLKNNPDLFEFLAAFLEQDRLADKNGNWLYDNFPISGKKESDNTELSKKFLDGKWLEAYVPWIIETKKPGLDPIANWEWETRVGQGSKKFEIDVFIKHGYQVCGISCGTAKSRQELKLKGFEVILRTRQLGGNEALAVLVTTLKRDVANELEQDLKASTGTSQEKFIILGIDDLHPEKMWSKIEKHIFGGR